MRRAHRALVASALGMGGVLGVAAVGTAGTEDAPLPTCTNPASSEQGDDLVVRGRNWEPESTVTLYFDEGDDFDDFDDVDDDDVTDDTTPDDTTSDDTTSDDTTPDDTTSDTNGTSGADESLATAEVSDSGRFRVEVVVPEGAIRGTHSVNVRGVDEDGLPAHCARTVRLSDHPDDGTTDTTSPDGADDTTTTTDGTTPTTDSTSDDTTSTS